MFSSLCGPTGLASSDLVRRVARRASHRLRRVARVLGGAPFTRGTPGASQVAGAFLTEMRRLPIEERVALLHGPDLRGYLGEAEVWIEVVQLALHRDLERLFDRLSRTERLVELVPSGRIDPGLAPRAVRFARLRLREVTADLGAAILGIRLARPGGGPLALTFECREEPEQGRPADRIDLGTFCGPAGALGISLPPPARLRARLEGTTLLLRPPRGGEVVLPAAGSRLRAEGRSPGGDQRGPALVRRETIPGTAILLAPALRSGPRRLGVGRPVEGLGERLARALRIVGLAWPEGHREILLRTAMVVPVREPGLVSYSLASRPGVSFINVFGKTSLGLADDLLHETAHHLLHDVEEIARLLAPGSATRDVQAFHSPWRGTMRPLRGLLHGTYTFLFRAELFHRVLRIARARPGLLLRDLGPRRAEWVRREVRRETGQISRALRDLDRAARAGLLTPSGRNLLRGMRRWHGRLGRD